MTDKILNDLAKQNERLINEKEELHHKLNEALDVIEAIRRGKIDAVFTADTETPTILVSKTADQAYRRFIENMSEGVLTLHTDGIIVYSNSSFAKMVNTPLTKVIGINVRNFIPDEYSENFEEVFNKNPDKNHKVELSVVNPNGTRSHFIVSPSTLQLQDFLALNLVWTDVTVQKEAEEKLIVVNDNLKSAIEERVLSENKVIILNNKLKENIKILEYANIELATFAHIASHDLQEPLRKIITFSGLLISDYYKIIGAKGQKYINTMQLAAERMRSLINDILEYSQLSHKDFVFNPISIQTIVKEIISNLEIVIKETNAKITIEKELPVIEANSSQMRQLFQNLISNSIKFVKAGTIPEINITYEIVKGNEIEKMDKKMWNEHFCLFFVKDNGIGFQNEYIDKIFNIFQRLHNNSVYKGTGIGLAICKKIVEKHNGFITAESGPGKGALFTITLPVSHSQSRKHNQKEQSLYEGISNS